jgi:hypothetical protein
VATGREDFLYGQILLFEEEPTSGRTDTAPTSDWAYDHEHNENVHHTKFTAADAVDAMGVEGDSNPFNHTKYADSDAVDAMGVKSNSNPLNHDRFDVSEVLATTSETSGLKNCVTAAAQGDMGVYTEMIASIAADSKVVGFYVVHYATTFNSRLDIAIGSGGSEVVVVEGINFRAYQTNLPVFFPFLIPSGSRVAFRISNDSNNNQYTLQLALYVLE